MSTRSHLNLLDTVVGDVVLEQQQAADIGAAMGNGAASFTSPAAAGVIPMGEGGNLSVITAQPGTSPGSAAADIVMAVYTLPAGALDIANRMLEITANGAVANATSKTMKLIVGATNPTVGQAASGGTAIAALTTTTAGGWSLSAEIAKYGSKGSNTQQAIHTASQAGNVVGLLQAPSALTLNEAAPITIAVTCNAASTLTDVVFNSLQVAGSN